MRVMHIALGESAVSPEMSGHIFKLSVSIIYIIGGRFALAVLDLLQLGG